MRLSYHFCIPLLSLLLATASALAEVYEIRGVVLELSPEIDTVVVRHEAVPGFMPAMTMPFAVRDASELTGLSVNDEVSFEFVMGSGASFARNFEVTGQAEPTTAAGSGTASRPQSTRLEEGSQVPDTELTDQFGNVTGLRDEAGRFTLLTFIFTRCPVPDFCPLMSSKFGELQRRFDQGGIEEKVRLLSITIDPEFDTPEVLRQYGESLRADFGNWTFATGEPELIDAIASAFRLYRERDGVTLDHALCTALVSPDGTVLEIWRGNRWETDAAYASTREAIGNAAD